MVAAACASGTAALGAARDLLAAHRCDIVHKGPRRTRIRAALTQSSGFAGHTAAAVFTTV